MHFKTPVLRARVSEFAVFFLIITSCTAHNTHSFLSNFTGNDMEHHMQIGRTAVAIQLCEVRVLWNHSAKYFESLTFIR